MVNGVEVVTQTVLSMRPLLNEDIKGMTAQDHLHHLSMILGMYGKSDTNIVCLIGDNCAVNQSMSKILKAPLVGCGSHKFNLAVRKWISNQPQLEKIIQCIANVMKKASTLKVSALLRKLTTLRTVRENDTRWSSTFMMVERFFEIQRELSAVPDLIPLIPNLLEIDLLAKAFVHLQAFNEITVMLQEEITFVGVRDIFDSVLIDYPELSGHLGPGAKIVVDAVFEKAIVQIAKGVVLTPEERQSVQGLIRPALADGTSAGSFSDMSVPLETQGNISYAQKVQDRVKRQKTGKDTIASEYINLDIVAGTSVSCERLFSSAKHILTDTRKSTSPAVFEAILLLKVNRSEWDVHTMGRAMGRTTGAIINRPGSAGIDDTTSNLNVDVVDEDEEDPDLFYE